MTVLTAPTFSQIKAQVSAIRQKAPQARVIGIHSPGRWTGESVQQDGEQRFVIYQCDSPLAIRIALREPAADNTTRVLITSLSEDDLGDDILLRLAKRHLYQIDQWQIVRTLFDASALDPRLTVHAWIAESLLEFIPPEGYPAARGGFLDAETVWPLLLSQAIGLKATSPDLKLLLEWSLDAENAARFRRCSKSFRSGAAHWLSEKAGPVAETILHCLEELDRPDIVPIGLAVGVVFHTAASGKLEKAAGKLEERFLRGQSLPSEHMQRWSTAAGELVRSLRLPDPKLHRQIIQRADEILREVGAEEFAYLSDTSSLGFDQRLTRVGVRLSELLQCGSWNQMDALLESHRAVCRHDQADNEGRRLERISMALRLIRWLAWRQQNCDSQGTGGSTQRTLPDGRGPGELPRSLGEAANHHLHEGGYVDWARLSLRSGDPVRELSESYARLFEVVTGIRQHQAQAFARLLADATSAGTRDHELIPIERVLEEVVAPLAAEALVLVIVIDGMSVAVCRELLADVTRHEWFPISEPGRTFNRPALAAIPSMTEYSRTSLFCGRLQQGTAADEKVGFAGHAALVARSRSGSPPILFHKAGLQESEDTVLAADVRKEIASTHRKVVGVVINAVDDHLDKGGQIDTRWSRDEIRVLPALLHEARIARRLVVLISDHGHILDCQAEHRPFKDELFGGERWRVAAGVATSEELLIAGPRVLARDHRLIAPWSERVRYVSKKTGYHGGLSPQEMVIPIAVLSSTEDIPTGWTDQPLDSPIWWDEPSTEPTSVELPAPQLKPLAPQPGRLFNLEMEEIVVRPAGVESVESGDVRNSDQAGRIDTPVLVPEPQTEPLPQWVQRLLACPVFEDQKRLGGRNLPADEVIAKLLSCLDSRGGKLTSAALARALELATVRLPGLLAKAERILNVDGYECLRRDDASDTIELNRDLLLMQFDLV